MDTIFALSSGAVPCGVAVVRVSGPLAATCLRALCGKLPAARQAELRLIIRPSDGKTLDQGLVLWFPSPRSLTGEDVAEFHVHGGRAVVQALFDTLTEQGARYAEAGEFSRRAFLNQKLDLTEVEGLADLIAADTEAQRSQAFALLQGGLATRASVWRDTILQLRAEVEARLDFSDEGDVPASLLPSFWTTLDDMRHDMREVLDQAETGMRTRCGFRVAILGRPNAGKSSLLNTLARTDVAIVTGEPGTTRDVLEVSLVLGGYLVVLLDTAGLREAASLAEQEGVRRAILAAERADLVLWLEDCRTEPELLPFKASVPVWRVRTKADLLSASVRDRTEISVVDGTGVRQFVESLNDFVARGAPGGSALITRQRQRAAVLDAVSDLDSVANAPEEVAADLLRSASEAIGRLTGRIGVDEVLDRLFGEFCIGK